MSQIPAHTSGSQDFKSSWCGAAVVILTTVAFPLLLATSIFANPLYIIPTAACVIAACKICNYMDKVQGRC